MNTVEIKSSKTKLILMLLGSIMFIVLGIFLTIHPGKFVSIVFESTSIVRTAGISSVIFWSMSYIFIKKHFD